MQTDIKKHRVKYKRLHHVSTKTQILNDSARLEQFPALQPAIDFEKKTLIIYSVQF